MYNIKDLGWKRRKLFVWRLWNRQTDGINFGMYSQRPFEWYMTRLPKLKISWRRGKRIYLPITLKGRHNSIQRMQIWSSIIQPTKFCCQACNAFSKGAFRLCNFVSNFLVAREKLLRKLQARAIFQNPSCLDFYCMDFYCAQLYRPVSPRLSLREGVARSLDAFVLQRLSKGLKSTLSLQSFILQRK